MVSPCVFRGDLICLDSISKDATHCISSALGHSAAASVRDPGEQASVTLSRVLSLEYLRVGLVGAYFLLNDRHSETLRLQRLDSG